ncbi:uncharacterized protein LACBIDRAFT_322497 [Laccaria bicolor S238N-H82]|uniref:Predicted protein n=1 Tax=Laccaria bicolor (strain S238N-H82 / ATCC MYA-4686) TaxID=486041 RepID=B0CWH9_LACBS|nr:uncharacterized protein LACBIDRAFT_322497 [Laccaria bicolor S238N-H82]EDR13512.1 predicted protein [Laccaria bicolor S238N-H82]|eukprot:XP_001876010.1 predicted protein [Laccaria bicolor S238N-H82]
MQFFSLRWVFTLEPLRALFHVNSAGCWRNNANTPAAKVTQRRGDDERQCSWNDVQHPQHTTHMTEHKNNLTPTKKCPTPTKKHLAPTKKHPVPMMVPPSPCPKTNPHEDVFGLTLGNDKVPNKVVSNRVLPMAGSQNLNPARQQASSEALLPSQVSASNHVCKSHPAMQPSYQPPDVEMGSVAGLSTGRGSTHNPVGLQLDSGRLQLDFWSPNGVQLSYNQMSIFLDHPGGVCLSGVCVRPG